VCDACERHQRCAGIAAVDSTYKLQTSAQSIHEVHHPSYATGFLGAGKSTLVRHILTAQHGRRIAVIVNEFGEELGIERAIVNQNDVSRISSPRTNLHPAGAGDTCCAQSAVCAAVANPVQLYLFVLATGWDAVCSEDDLSPRAPALHLQSLVNLHYRSCLNAFSRYKLRTGRMRVLSQQQ
jgi:CobW/HypB/UreG, nucleotide-binding domain